MHRNVLYELSGYPEHPTITPFGGKIHNSQLNSAREYIFDIFDKDLGID
jgi:hypothetical protein